MNSKFVIRNETDADVSTITVVTVATFKDLLWVQGVSGQANILKSDTLF